MPVKRDQFLRAIRNKVEFYDRKSIIPRKARWASIAEKCNGTVLEVKHEWHLLCARNCSYKSKCKADVKKRFPGCDPDSALKCVYDPFFGPDTKVADTKARTSRNTHNNVPEPTQNNTEEQINEFDPVLSLLDYNDPLVRLDSNGANALLPSVPIVPIDDYTQEETIEFDPALTMQAPNDPVFGPDMNVVEALIDHNYCLIPPINYAEQGIIECDPFFIDLDYYDPSFRRDTNGAHALIPEDYTQEESTVEVAAGVQRFGMDTDESDEEIDVG